jgi:hypothetical protein
MSTCPSCGHSVLLHRVGICHAVVLMNRSGSKGHCGCTAIQPSNTTEQPRLPLERTRLWDEDDE